MNLNLSSEDSLVAESALRWLQAERLASSALTRWQEFAEMGWLGLPIAEDCGGIGALDSTLAALVEQFGYACCNEPFLPVVVTAGGLLARVNNAATRALLAGLVSGDERIVLADESLLEAQRMGEVWRLSGVQPLVLGGDVASHFIVAAAGPNNATCLFVIARDAPGLTLLPVQCLGACNAADLRFHDVTGTLIANEEVPALLEWARDRTTAMACADAVGAIRYLVEATIAYTNARQQFKRPLAQFQVVEHFRADLLIASEEARAITQLALAAIDCEPHFRQRAVSAAKVKVGEAARTVAQQSIQLHGAMGVTDELKIGLYMKRLLAFDAQSGLRDSHLQRYARCARENGTTGNYLAQPTGTDSGIHLCLSAESLKFRVAVREFLENSLPDSLSNAQSMTTTVYPDADVAGQWHKLLHARGWSAPNWPQRFGGTGWSAEERYIWVQECNAANAPIISPLGLPLVGPVLMQFGSALQQSRFLPPIVSGEELWCQGFSEPGAGSDLAALSTRAVSDGDDYVVDGTKIWTTHGHFAHYMAALVRTGPSGGRRDGISFLLIDLRSSGIVIRPIMTIGGDHELNQIFFDGVRVPRANLVGAEGQGWEIAKYMLEYERGGDIMSGGHRRLLADLRELAISRPLADLHAFWRAYARVAIDIDALEMLELRTLLGCVDVSPAVASILKLRASEIQQSVTELGVLLLGRDAVRWEAQRPLSAVHAATKDMALVSRYLNSRANTIFGGAREIQKTLIARAAATA